MATSPPHRPTLTLAHSPDPDDAFMWWPLDSRDPAIDTGRFEFRLAPADIQSLNDRALTQGDLDITALSIHTYPHVKDRYALTSCGASMGDGYGPRLVAREPVASIMGLNASRKNSEPGAPCDPAHTGPERPNTPASRIATPGLRTTAHLVLQMMLRAPRWDRGFAHQTAVLVPMPFDQILSAVLSGDVDAGLVIHEAQLTYADAGLALIADLGAWWRGETGLPLPLGGNAIRRDLDERFGAGTREEVTAILLRSIQHALCERDTSLLRANEYARGLDQAVADEFISMYVNSLTIDAGGRGLEAIRALLRTAHAMGLCPDPGEIEFIRPAPSAVQTTKTRTS